MTSSTIFPCSAGRTLNALVVAAFTAGAVFVTTPVYAAGEGGSRSTPSCKRGKVWDKRKRKCVKAARSSNLSDDNIYEAARDLAYKERYDEAITVLKLAKNQQDPRILNYMGYSTRKSGDVKKGLEYYYAAIKINPDYTLARSYMGEAYLQLGDRKSAMVQLAEIKSRCGEDCREYGILKAKLEGEKTGATW